MQYKNTIWSRVVKQQNQNTVIQKTIGTFDMKCLVMREIILITLTLAGQMKYCNVQQQVQKHPLL